MFIKRPFFSFVFALLLLGSANQTVAQQELLQKTFGHFLPKDDKIRVVCDIRMDIKRPGSKFFGEQIHNCFILEIDSGDRIREVGYEILDDGNRAFFPFSESVFDRSSLVELFDEKKAPQIFITFNPPLSETHGSRANGFLAIFGLSAFHTKTEWNLFRIAELANLKLSRTENGDVLLSGDSNVGKMTFEIESKTFRPKRIHVQATQSLGMYYSDDLSEWKYQDVSLEVNEFQFSEPTAENPTGLQQYSFQEVRTFKDKTERVIRGTVEFSEISRHPETIPPVNQQLKFLTPIAENTHVEVTGESLVRRTYRNGRIENFAEASYESQLNEIAQSIRQKKLLKEDTNWRSPETSGLCGLHSLHVISQYLEMNTKLADLHEIEFCSTAIGSKAKDLGLATKHLGLNSKLVSGLSVSDIRSMELPMILHVRPRGRAEEFSHWVAYLGTDQDGSLLIVDSAFGLERMSEAELASRMDGTALIVATHQRKIDTQLQSLRMARMTTALLWSFGILGMTILVRAGGQYFQKSSILPGVVIVGFVCLGLSYQFVMPDGLLGSKLEVARRLAVNSDRVFPEIDLADVQQIVKDQNSEVALIDARYRSSFAYGSIDGSINYPLDIRSDREARLVEKIRGKKKFVVFCQSKSCRFADDIAKRLAAMGIDNVYIFPGGIRQWQAEVK